MQRTLKYSALAVLFCGLAFTAMAFAKMGIGFLGGFVVCIVPYLLMALVVRAARSLFSSWVVMLASLGIFCIAIPDNSQALYTHISVLGATAFTNLALIQVVLVVVARLIVWRRELR